MKYPVTRFKSLAIALKELELSIRNGRHLQTGEPFEKFGGMRSREALANWLLCAAVNSIDNRNLTFCSDPLGGDGIICDQKTDETWPTEHIMVPRLCPGETAHADALILNAIQQKCSKGGAAYATGKTLIVFMEAGASAGEWHPNKVARLLPDPMHFAAVWVVGLHSAENGAYAYNVACLDISDGNSPVLREHIGKGFDAWTVERIQ